jgi:hypothetical protein
MLASLCSGKEPRVQVTSGKLPKGPSAPALIKLHFAPHLGYEPAVAAADFLPSEQRPTAPTRTGLTVDHVGRDYALVLRALSIRKLLANEIANEPFATMHHQGAGCSFKMRGFRFKVITREHPSARQISAVI